MWSLRVLLKYTAIQLAGWIVVVAAAFLIAEHFRWPRHIIWIILALWVLKDAALYPLVWRAYDARHRARSPYPPEGTEGIALRRLSPAGTARIGGELWKARVEDGRHIEEGERVRVTGRDGMTLIVAPAGRP